MSYYGGIGYPTANVPSGPPVSASGLPAPTTFNNNNNQILGSPNSSSGGGGGMSGSTSPTGITTSPGTGCCEGGRPLVTDPITGQSVCSCQYDPSRLTLSSYPRLTAYGPTPYAPATEQNPYPSLESSAFYSPLVSSSCPPVPPYVAPTGLNPLTSLASPALYSTMLGQYYPSPNIPIPPLPILPDNVPRPPLIHPYAPSIPEIPIPPLPIIPGNVSCPPMILPYAPSLPEIPYYGSSSTLMGGAYAGLKEGSGTGDVSCWPNPGSLQSSYYPYDPTFAAAYGYGGGYDLAARRKNATRESTATLKAWLNEHKKNPYPTKGEKIMLAIITKMTLTQVSTWFANARRRLKKENKMTWEPKNKTDDDDEDMKDDDDDENSSNATPNSPGINNNNNNGIKNDPSDLKSDCAATSKPKIWSLADTAACKTPPPPQHLLGHPHHHNHPGSHHHHHNNHNHGHLSHPMSHHPGGPPPAPPVSSSWSFALPPAYRYGGGFLPPVSNEGVGTDTPPQTPPNLKVPLLPGSLSHFAPGTGNSSGLTSSSDLATTAFKPVLKSSSGGFCM